MTGRAFHPASTPAAIVQQGTTAEQRVVVGTLADLAGRAFDARLAPLTLIIVGDVVRLQKRLDWFHPSADELEPPLRASASGD